MRGNTLASHERALVCLFVEGLASFRPWAVSLGLHALVIIALAIRQLAFFGLAGSPIESPKLPLICSISISDETGRGESEVREGETGEASQPQAAAFRESQEAGIDEIDSGEGEYGIYSEKNPEIMLVIWITIPNYMKDQAYRLPLSRMKLREPRFGPCYCSNGDGRNCYSSISLFGHSGTGSSIIVSLRGTWKAQDESRGSFDTDLPIEIMKPSSLDIEGGVEVRWTFEAPPEAGAR